MNVFPIIHAHIHIWDLDRLRYPWLDGVPKINRSHLLADYDAARGAREVEALVFVQCECLPEQHLEELAWVRSCADADSRLKAIVPWAPLEPETTSSVFQIHRMPMHDADRPTLTTSNDSPSGFSL